jgi:translocator protein
MSFFESLAKPSWIPPDWVFPAAWFTLWALQATALVRLVGLSSSSKQRTALAFLILQFVAAIAWQGAIFGPGRLRLAAIWLTMVLALVVLAAAATWRADRVAGLLVAPTIVWVTIATTLGWELLRLNPNA